MPTADVARYYDRNTRRFLFMGGGRRAHSIHRELWGPGVESAREATDYIDGVIADEIAGLGASPTIVDFGCGVGGTLFHLAGRFPDARLMGITVSGRQVALAEQRAHELGHAERCSFALGDFQTAELQVRADAVVAVESFAHSDSADAFLSNAVKHLRRDGRLIITDDFLAAPMESLEKPQRLLVHQFQAGWRVPAVCTTEALVTRAGKHGLALEEARDLTSFTRPGSRTRDRLTGALSPALARLGLTGIPFCGNLIGGHALQVGLREGFLRYRLLIFRKKA